MKPPALGELKHRLSARGIRLKKSLGQNLLLDGNMCRAIARTSGAAKGDTVLEVGTGLGHLTSALAGTGAGVLTVEIDRGLYELAGEYLAEIQVEFADTTLITWPEQADDWIWSVRQEVTT